jgi:hypothetical protein
VHLRENGFKVTTHDTDDLPSVKTNNGVPGELEACHTGLVGGYVVEGHVPADLIHRLLKERPKVVGIVVPGMPSGSPGMDGPRRGGYNVLLWDQSGKTSVYARR